MNSNDFSFGAPEVPTTEEIAGTENVMCTTDRQSWSCKNMQEVVGDLSMTHEHYKCELCGRRMKLDYDEMR